MLASILAVTHTKVGLTTTQGCYVNSDLVREGDSSNCRWARWLASEYKLDCAVFEMARGGLARLGIGLSNYDVGVVTNVLDNHLGLDGIRTRQEMADLKGCVAEKSGRYAILNADDPLCLGIARRAAAEKIFVSARRHAPALAEHRTKGGLTAIVEDRVIQLARGQQVLGHVDTREIPASFNGAFFPVAINAAFAVAAAYALGAEFHSITTALRCFQSDVQDNPGRTNYFPRHSPKLLLTWADGPEACSHLKSLIRSLGSPMETILVLCAAGNRSDQFIFECGKALSGSCDRYICCDWEDRRGRPQGEVARMLAEGLSHGGVPRGSIEILPDHNSAVEFAIARAKPGELVVVVSYSSTMLAKSVGRAPASDGL